MIIWPLKTLQNLPLLAAIHYIHHFHGPRYSPAGENDDLRTTSHRLLPRREWTSHGDIKPDKRHAPFRSPRLGSPDLSVNSDGKTLVFRDVVAFHERLQTFTDNGNAYTVQQDAEG
ncbi:hypothetical protein CONLIGDRAFT_685828 [Coniochaeta ligniaria NRRL 30616]|uniref:Uncharacterized protein n=1 Tax=Coniochaeta ligniaria NRRL 30616 TaxID=1408157 RepID=A0A1J7ISY1_9PEZI|nr:hypothetical protein CONLIGDRAFT_685828 [Coniochaeta ligniaria NRRL 30616]